MSELAGEDSQAIASLFASRKMPLSAGSAVEVWKIGEVTELADAAPSCGPTKVGPCAKTADPVPVSSLSPAAKSCRVGDRADDACGSGQDARGRGALDLLAGGAAEEDDLAIDRG